MHSLQTRLSKMSNPGPWPLSRVGFIQLLPVALVLGMADHSCLCATGRLPHEAPLPFYVSLPVAQTKFYHLCPSRVRHPVNRADSCPRCAAAFSAGGGLAADWAPHGVLDLDAAALTVSLDLEDLSVDWTTLGLPVMGAGG